MTPTGALGLIAGGGDLPRAVAQSAKAAGREVFVVPLVGSVTEDWINGFHHEFLSPGEPGRIIRAMKAHGVTQVLMCGRVDRPKFNELKLDAKGMLLLPRAIAAATGSTGSPLSFLRSSRSRAWTSSMNSWKWTRRLAETFRQSWNKSISIDLPRPTPPHR